MIERIYRTWEPTASDGFLAMMETVHRSLKWDKRKPTRYCTANAMTLGRYRELLISMQPKKPIAEKVFHHLLYDGYDMQYVEGLEDGVVHFFENDQLQAVLKPLERSLHVSPK